MNFLKITAKLMTGIVADRWLPLDGILLYHGMQQKYGDQQITPIAGGQKIDYDVIPLDIKDKGQDNWYFACSWAYPKQWWLAEGTCHWNKRADIGMADYINFGKKRGKITTSEGKYRPYYYPIFYKVADKIEWYCIGDKEKIEHLLKFTTHIGKKGSQGWGRVLKWTVENIKEDFSCKKDGKLTRGVINTDIIGSIAYYGIRPPYYSQENTRMLVMPS